MTEIQVKYWANKEIERSNKARETETHRANLAGERETYRHNVAGENVASATLGESIRHNKRTEELTASQVQEQRRSNLANEGIRLATVNETIRSNKAKEAETKRSNLAKESETHRSNVAKESETRRSNLRNEELTYMRDQDTYYNNREKNRIQERTVNSQIKLNEAKAATESAKKQQIKVSTGLDAARLPYASDIAQLQVANYAMQAARGGISLGSFTMK